MIKNFQKRYFEVLGNTVYYYSNEQKSEKKGEFCLIHTKISPNNSLGKAHCIEISPEFGSKKPRKYYLCTQSSIEQEEWINALMKASVWDPHLDLPQKEIQKIQKFEAHLFGIMFSKLCSQKIEELLQSSLYLNPGITKTQFDFEKETIMVEGFFNHLQVISLFEDAGFFVYQIKL